MTGPGGAVVGRVSIQVLPDTSSFREKLKSQLAAAVKGVKVDVPVDLETGAAMAELAALKTSINEVDGVNVSVNTEQIGEATNQISALGKAMRSTTNKAKAFSRSTRAMSRGMFILVASTALAAPAIGGIATLLAGLPSLLSAAGAGFAAVALGMEGVKEAASVLSDEVESLKSRLSQEWEDSLTPVMEDLSEVFPELEDGLSEVVEGLSHMAEGFADAVTSAQGMAAIEDILENTGNFFSSLQPMVENFTAAFLTLAQAGSQQFGMLRQTLNDFAADFNSMIQQVTSNGTFAAAMTGLNQVLSSVLNLFNQLFLAGLKVMAQIGGPMSQAINAFGGFMKALLPILGTLTSTLFSVLTPVLKALTPILIALQPLFKQIGNVIIATVVPAVQALAPFLKRIATFLSQNAAWIAPLIVSLYGLNKAYKIVRGTIVGLVTKYRTLRRVAKGLKTFWDDKFIPSLNRVGASFKRATKKVKKTTGAMKKLGSKGVKKVETGWKRLRKIFTSKKGAFAIVAALVIWVVDLIIQNWDKVVQFLDWAWSEIVAGAKRWWNKFVGTISGAYQTAKSIINTIGGAIDWFQSKVQSIDDAIANFFSDIGSWLWREGGELISGLWNGIASKLGWLWDKLTGAVQGIIDYVGGLFGISSPSKVFREIGQFLTIGLAEGITDRERDVMRAMHRFSDIGAHVGLDSASNVDGPESMEEMIANALSNWSIEVDREGLAQMVNYTNRLNDRRG